MCAASVRRVVVTSSIRAVFGFGNEKPQGYVYGEDDWNETSTLENNQAYSLSKTLAEVSEPHMQSCNQLYQDTEPCGYG
jgi:nucleoside-diphosphate-sugar epimerase